MMLEKVLAFLKAAWALYSAWSARSKEQAAEKTAEDKRAGAEEAAAETATVVAEVANERAKLAPPSSDPAALASELRKRKTGKPAASGRRSF